MPEPTRHCSINSYRDTYNCIVLQCTTNIGAVHWKTTDMACWWKVTNTFRWCSYKRHSLDTEFYPRHSNRLPDNRNNNSFHVHNNFSHRVETMQILWNLKQRILMWDEEQVKFTAILCGYFNTAIYWLYKSLRHYNTRAEVRNAKVFVL